MNFALGAENSKNVSFLANLSYQHRDNLDYMFTFFGARLNRTGLEVPPTSLRYAGTESENDVAHPYSAYTKVALFNNKLDKLTFSGNLQYLDSYVESADWGILTHNNRISLHNYYARPRYDRQASDNLYATGAVSASGGGTNPDNSYDYGRWYYLAEDYGFHSAGDSVELVSFAPDTSFGNVGVYTWRCISPRKNSASHRD